ncbi:MAG TPA: ABC transporter permease [Streptosporangiaceae bacterium]|nr:ABC transporter permease [Streptosporangiaceae bacterium]
MMTDSPRPARPARRARSAGPAAPAYPAAIARPAAPPGAVRASLEVARRALRKFFRTPGLWAMGLVTSVLFLFTFRYVFGGAVQGGAARYADYLIPGYVATIVLFTGAGIAVAVAEDRVSGFTGRLLSLPVPRTAIALGRALADFTTNVWSILATAAFGFLFGFRLGGTVADGLAALGLCLAYGLVFTAVFMVIGLAAPNGQAAQGMSMIAFVFAFISSTYVPASTMPGWLQPFAKYQPITPMVDAVRSLIAGSTSDVALALAWSALLLAVFTPVAVLRYYRV